MESDPGKKSATRLRTQPPRILVVDDDLRVAEAIALELDEYDVVIACDGHDALAVLHEEAEFQLVLCDLMMPTMSGPELYAALELEHPEVLPRIVFMTGCAFTPSSRAFLTTVSNTVIEKPFEPDELCKFVSEFLAKQAEAIASPKASAR